MADPAPIYDPDKKTAITRPDLQVLEGGGKTSPPTGNLSAAPEPDDLAQKEQTPTDPDQVGRGYTGTSKQNKQKGRKWLFNKRRTALGGGIIGTIIGLLMLFTISSGPLQLIHLSQILSKNFFGSEKASANRTNGLFRYARTSDVGETRVGKLGSKVFGRTITQLSDIGIEFQRTSLAGNAKSMTIDTDKLAKRYPELKGMSAAQKQSFLADKFGLSGDQLIKVGTGNNNWMVNTRNFGIRATRMLVSNTLGTLENGKIVTGIKGRVMAKFFNIPSLWHPIKRAIASQENKFATKVARAVAEKERLKPLTPPEDSTLASAKKNIKDKVRSNQGLISAALLGTTALCLVRSVADDVVTVNRTAIVAPAAIGAADKIAGGAQVQSGQDITAGQVGAIVESFQDSSGKSIWGSKALQATAGESNPGGEDIPADFQQAFSNDTTAQHIKDTIGSPTIAGYDLGGALCSTPGVIIQGAVGVALLVSGPFTGGTTWAAFAAKETASLAATAGVVYLLQQQFTNLLSDKAIVPDILSGPVGGNLLAYGAREAANIDARASGGVEFSSSETAVLDKQQQALDQEQFHSKSLVSRVFDVHDSRSLVSKFIDKASPNPARNLASAASSFTNFGGLVSSLFSTFVPKTQAAGQPYDWGFPRYGIPAELLNDSTLEDPYDNADKVAALLNGGDSHGYIGRAEKCFGIKISNGPDGWDAVAQSDVNPNDEEYVNSDCGNTNDENWKRVMLFVFDTRTMEAIACYEGDDQICSELGFDSTSSSTVVVDSGFTMTKLSPPLATPGGQITPKGITLHWWGSGSNGQGIDALVSALRGNNTCGSSGCSVQVGITADGKVYQMTDSLTDLTYHAIGANETTIGIEIEGGPADFGQAGIDKYPEKFNAVVSTVRYLVNKYNLSLDGEVICRAVSGVHPHSAYNLCPGALPKEDIDDAYFNAVMQKVRQG